MIHLKGFSSTTTFFYNQMIMVNMLQLQPTSRWHDLCPSVQKKWGISEVQLFFCQSHTFFSAFLLVKNAMNFSHLHCVFFYNLLHFVKCFMEFLKCYREAYGKNGRQNAIHRACWVLKKRPQTPRRKTHWNRFTIVVYARNVL